MRPPGRRLSVRDLTIAIAAFALSLKLGLAYNRSPSYWKEADFYANRLAEAHQMTEILESEYQPPRLLSTVSQPMGGSISAWSFSGPNLQGEERLQAAKGSQKFAEYLDGMRAKYRRAAFFPWLPDVPEPPDCW